MAQDNQHNQCSATGVTLLKKMVEKPDGSLSTAIGHRALSRYSVPPKPLQIDTVVNLARGRNVILLAGTGFGKSRIAEMYHDLVPKLTKGVVLVLNPLDALGNNQVSEKITSGFTSINLTKLTFNHAEACKIRRGEYSFVYLSPEIYLNSKLFASVYFSAEFQSRIALVVVDEAHLIYHWGIVKSTRGKKKTSALGRYYEDRGTFRPSYGNLYNRLLARNGAPILLLSATCPPKTLRAIQCNLKMDSSKLVILRGELTRTEIRIVRVFMKGSMTSFSDLADLYTPISVSDIPNEKVVPSLIYCNTRRRTGQVLEVLATARGTPKEASESRSLFARRYHSCTGDQDKQDVEKDFGEGVFPIVSCTMALGLGQNWTRVRSVVHMGRGDPSAICQMIGRCGRDGKPGLAILFVEKTRTNGKNATSQFKAGVEQSENDRMDALAVTPVCLRIAFAVDNLYGYIPLSSQDDAYQAEMAREKSQGFPNCRCSNCLPTKAALLMKRIGNVNIDVFDDVVLHDLHPDGPLIENRKSSPHQRSNEEPMTAEDTHIFGMEEIDSIIGKIAELEVEEDLRVVVGGHHFTGPGSDGLVSQLLPVIQKFKTGVIYLAYQARLNSILEDK
ncbi:hypothetical protein PCASD_10484 [Puccinia coronata f. sp. avenae]|uniref:DNA 3'-5' helicase n=1 Tax=Puccinia coronata f. sp. avenae TaxID=200324 RepID=A0A2N5TFF8_9BASI|nr:hypothetical protein PCASD_10484 [Puccinia coronata f. sp. avenae]